MIEQYLTLFVVSRIITITIETCVLFFITKIFRKSQNLNNRRILLTGILASTITLPVLRFVLPNLFQNYDNFVIFGEIFVTIAEIFIIKFLLNISRRKAIIASIICNVVSFVLGLFII